DNHTRAFPATPPPGRARQSPRGPAPWLEIDGERKPLHTAVTMLGRDESATIVIDDPGVSRRHAEIRVSHDGPHLQVLIRDAGSTNGTFLNGDQIGTEELSDGDRITMGRSTLTFHLDRT
ncbi:MAG: FHA domain-containing protein, partial [Ornithinimicrobium sp.]